MLGRSEILGEGCRVIVQSGCKVVLSAHGTPDTLNVHLNMALHSCLEMQLSPHMASSGKEGKSDLQCVRRHWLVIVQSLLIHWPEGTRLQQRIA